MTLVRTRTLPRRMRTIDNDLFSDVDRFFGTAGSLFARTSSGGYPVDLYETEHALVLQMAVPGLGSDDLDISVEGRQLSVRGTLADNGETDPSDDSERRYWLQSIPRGDFSRNVRLPASVDTDAIEARVIHGMLTLTMPKVAAAKVKKIPIAAS
jgi:HSP20 family protein